MSWPRSSAWNEAATHLFGYAADDIVGRSAQVLWPEDQYIEAQALLDRARQGHHIPTRDATRCHKDGRLLAVTVTLTPITDAENRANPDAPAFGKQLRYVPRRQLKLHTGLGWRALRLDLAGRFVSRRFLASDESTWLDAYPVFDAWLRAEHAFSMVKINIALGVENLFDADYEIIRLYPMPPRHARLRLTLDLNP